MPRDGKSAAEDCQVWESVDNYCLLRASVVLGDDEAGGRGGVPRLSCYFLVKKYLQILHASTVSRIFAIISPSRGGTSLPACLYWLVRVPRNR